MTKTEAKWSERVKEWKASGQTAREFANGREFRPSTLTYWASRLRQVGSQPQSPTTADGSAIGSPRTPRVRVARVRRTRADKLTPVPKTAAGTSMSSATMVIAIGPARIEVRSGFDRALLGEVVDALGGAR